MTFFRTAFKHLPRACAATVGTTGCAFYAFQDKFTMCESRTVPGSYVVPGFGYIAPTLPPPPEIPQPTVMIICGSVRKDSYHLRLGNAVATALADMKDPKGNPIVRVISVDESDPLVAKLPLYNQDEMIKNGHPTEAKQLRHLADQADAFLFLSPEYNGMLTPCMSNTLAYLSRPVHESDCRWSNCCFRGKPAAILSMSPGQLGGIRAHVSITQILSNLGLNVLANKKALGTDREDPFEKVTGGGCQFKEKYAGLQKQMESVILDLLKQAVALKLVEQYSYGDLGNLTTRTYQENPGAKQDASSAWPIHHRECSAFTTKDH